MAIVLQVDGQKLYEAERMEELWQWAKAHDILRLDHWHNPDDRVDIEDLTATVDRLALELATVKAQLAAVIAERDDLEHRPNQLALGMHLMRALEKRPKG